ncbi:NAD(P)-dependent dehydrogenase (short-subunit alcohol dehydrogenase family) [Sphingomonas zeicaulis]
MQAVIPVMKKAGWGRIISTASAHSLIASPFKPAYVAATHDIAGLAKTAALEPATDRITVNCISPGYVWTRLGEQQIPDTRKARNLTREKVINDMLLAPSPPSNSSRPSRWLPLPFFSAPTARRRSPGRTSPSTEDGSLTEGARAFRRALTAMAAGS